MNRALPWALAAAAAGLYWLCRGAYYVGFFNDDAFYIIGARSLLSGRYALLNVPGAPPLIQYLPGYSLILAPVAVIAGASLWPYQLASVAMMTATLLLLRDAWRHWPGELRAAALAACALCPLWVSMGAVVLSDVPLLFFLALSMSLSRRRWGREPLRDWLPLLLAFGLAGLVRPNGALLGLSAAAALLWRRRLRQASWCAAACALPLGFLLLRNTVETRVALTYFGEWSRAWGVASHSPGLAVVWGNLAFYLRFILVTTLMRWPWPWEWLAAATVGVGVVGIGYGYSRLEGDGDWELWPKLLLPSFLAVHLIWSKQAGRYVVPVLPLCAAYWLRGCGSLAVRGGFSKRLGWLLPAAMSVALSLSPDLRIVRASLWEKNAANSAPQRTAAWVRARTPPDTVLAAELDGRWYLLTGRRVVRLPRAHDGKELSAWADREGVRYVLAASNDLILRAVGGEGPHEPMSEDFLKLLLSDRARYRLVYADAEEGTELYERL